jgi:hypothetical protein
MGKGEEMILFWSGVFGEGLLDGGHVVYLVVLRGGLWSSGKNSQFQSFLQSLSDRDFYPYVFPFGWHGGSICVGDDFA